jgi:hypothetical protein
VIRRGYCGAEATKTRTTHTAFTPMKRLRLYNTHGVVHSLSKTQRPSKPCQRRERLRMTPKQALKPGDRTFLLITHVIILHPCTHVGAVSVGGNPD